MFIAISTRITHHKCVESESYDSFFSSFFFSCSAHSSLANYLLRRRNKITIAILLVTRQKEKSTVNAASTLPSHIHNLSDARCILTRFNNESNTQIMWSTDILSAHNWITISLTPMKMSPLWCVRLGGISTNNCAAYRKYTNQISTKTISTWFYIRFQLVLASGKKNYTQCAIVES